MEASIFFLCVCSTVVLCSALKLSLVLFDWLINSERQFNVVSVTLIEFGIRGSGSSSVQQRRTVGKHDAICGHWKLLRLTINVGDEQKRV